MMGSKERRRQFSAAAEQVTKVVKSAGVLVQVALAVAAVALVIGLAALALAARRPANG